MSDLLQSGHHPDADQLNAFVEHGLPAHERDATLAHLAACADCRAIVALSMPPFEETLPLPEPARRPWFSGWRLLWPIATAATLAVLVALSVHVRNISNAPTDSAALRAAKTLSPTPVPVAQSQPLEPKQKKSALEPATRLNRPTKLSPAPPASPKLAEEKAPAPPASRGRAIYSLSLQTAPANPASATTTAPTAGIASANGASASPSFDVAAKPRPEPLPPANTVLNAAPQMVPQVAASGPDANTNSSPMVLRSARSFAVSDLAQAVLRLHPLPSGLPALSVVNNLSQNQTLAVDTHGALFLTADSGEHWLPVAAQWPGRAVKVDLVYAGSSHRVSFFSLSASKSSSQFAPQADAVGGPVVISTGVSPSSLSGSITDAAGAVIPGATVIVSSSPNQLARMAKTDAKGNYLIDALVPGTYTVEANYPGFNKQQINGVAVVAGKAATANLTLPVGASTQTVEVTSAASQVMTPAPQTKMKAFAPAKALPPATIFEITTDTGEHWVSPDGLAWKRK